MMKCFLLRCLLVLLPCCVWGQADSSQLESWCKEGRAFVEQGDTAKAIVSYLKAAEQGDADAQCMLFSLYLDQRRYTTAEYWLDKAVKQGTPEAYYNKGMSLYMNSGDDLQKARDGLMYLEKAASMNHIDAIKKVLYYCYNSQDSSRWALAKPILLKGIELDLAEAKVVMTGLLIRGHRGVEQNLLRGKRMLEEISKNADIIEDNDCVYNLAQYYWELGGDTNRSISIAYYKQLYENDYHSLLFATKGEHCMNKGAFKDAFLFFETGCELGEASSCNHLGMYYMQGRGVEVDTSKALAYLLKAEELDSGFCYGFNNLGFYYEKGVGVKPNLKKAIDYYKKAVAGKHVYACNNLGNLYRLGKGVEQDLEKAFELYTISFEKGNFYAIYNLGQCYYQGMGCEQNREYAFRLIRYCADKGHFEANLFLAKAYVKGEPYLLKSKDKSIQHALRATYQYYTDVLWSRLGLWREKTWVY